MSQIKSNLEKVLPATPSREQFEWGREQVMQHMQDDVVEYDNKKAEALAKLMALIKRNHPAKHIEKDEAPKEKIKTKVHEEDADSGDKSTPNNTSTIFSKIALSAVASVAMIIGLRFGINYLPKSFISMPTMDLSVSDNTNDGSTHPPSHDSSAPPADYAANQKSSALKNIRSPASSNKSAINRKRKMDAARQRKQEGNFRDSSAYERQQMGPDGMPFNDATQTTQADYQMNNAEGPHEQDPLRRKLGRETVNPEEDQQNMQDRSPASDEEQHQVEHHESAE